MKKIRFIKEARIPMFNWKVGDEVEIGQELREMYHCFVDHNDLIEWGYAVWVEDEEEWRKEYDCEFKFTEKSRPDNLQKDEVLGKMNKWHKSHKGSRSTFWHAQNAVGDLIGWPQWYREWAREKLAEYPKEPLPKPPSNLQEGKRMKLGHWHTHKGYDWPEWIEETKAEFWEMWDYSYVSDEEVYNGFPETGENWIPEKAQLKLQYIYVLEEYCKENNMDYAYFSDGRVVFQWFHCGSKLDWLPTTRKEQAEKDMKPVLDKLKELSDE